MASRVYHKCPQCEKVSYFQPEEPRVCKACGAGDAPAEGMSTAASLGLGGIVSAAAGLFLSPFMMFGWLLCLLAVALGIAAIATREPDDETAMFLGITAIAAGALLGMLIWILWSLDTTYVGGSSYEGGGSGGGDSEPGGSGGGGGSGGDGGGSGGGGGGGSGGGGGGGSPSVGAPGPVLPLVIGALWWLRRRHA